MLSLNDAPNGSVYDFTSGGCKLALHNAVLYPGVPRGTSNNHLIPSFLSFTPLSRTILCIRIDPNITLENFLVDMRGICNFPEAQSFTIKWLDEEGKEPPPPPPPSAQVVFSVLGLLPTRTTIPRTSPH